MVETPVKIEAILCPCPEPEDRVVFVEAVIEPYTDSSTCLDSMMESMSNRKLCGELELCCA